MARLKDLGLCLHCGMEFEKKRSWQKFCNVQCRSNHFWETHKVVKVEKTPTPKEKVA